MMTNIQDAIEESIQTNRTVWVYYYTREDASELAGLSDSGPRRWEPRGLEGYPEMVSGVQYWGHDEYCKEWTVRAGVPRDSGVAVSRTSTPNPYHPGHPNALVWRDGHESGYAAGSAGDQTQIERQIWIATYGAAIGAGAHWLKAVELAASAVRSFREGLPGWQGGAADLMKELFP
jgi:hypothetical protein